MSKYMIVIFIILNLLTARCAPAPVTDIEVPIHGKLIYVEDIRDKHGLLAGRFGDLIMIDSKTQKRTILTDDRYYYATPNLVNNGTELWFESKRGTNLGTAGLGADSDLYRMDLETREISGLRDTLSELMGEDPGWRISRLSVSPSNNEYFFRRAIVDPEKSLNGMYYINSTNKKIVQATSSYHLDQLSLGNAYWSQNNNKIAYDIMPGSFTRVSLYDVEKDTVFILENKETKNDDIRVACDSGSWYDDQQFVYACKIRELDKTIIYLYDYKSGNSKQIGILTQKGLRINALNLSRDKMKIVFIGDTFEEYERISSDIYMFETESQKLTQLTETGGDKRWLRWYED